MDHTPHTQFFMDARYEPKHPWMSWEDYMEVHHFDRPSVTHALGSQLMFSVKHPKRMAEFSNLIQLVAKTASRRMLMDVCMDILRGCGRLPQEVLEVVVRGILRAHQIDDISKEDVHELLAMPWDSSMPAAAVVLNSTVCSSTLQSTAFLQFLLKDVKLDINNPYVRVEFGGDNMHVAMAYMSRDTLCRFLVSAVRRLYLRYALCIVEHMGRAEMPQSEDPSAWSGLWTILLASERAFIEFAAPILQTLTDTWLWGDARQVVYNTAVAALADDVTDSPLRTCLVQVVERLADVPRWSEARRVWIGTMCRAAFS